MPIDASALLDLLRVRPRLLALGEPTHGSDALLDMRNEVFRELVHGHEYRTIGIESDCLRALLVDDYVTTGTGSLDDVMERGFSHGWGSCSGNRELVRWLRDFNTDRPAVDMVHFAGVDPPMEMTAAASPRQALTALHSQLHDQLHDSCTASELDHLLGEDELWTDPEAMMDPERSVGQSRQAQALRLLADDLTALLDAIPANPAAQLYARTATGLLRYHHWMADTTSTRQIRFQRLCAQRDSMMAANMKALVGGAPTFVHAHNAHLQRHRSSMSSWYGPIEWWSAGALVGHELRDGYAFVPTAVGTIEDHDVTTPAPNTIEGHLYEKREDLQLVDVTEIPDNLEPRVSPWFGYAPVDPAHITDHTALLYVDNA